MILAHTQRHLSRGMNTEIQDGILVSAQDMHALPVVHAPDAQVEVLQYNAFFRQENMRMKRTVGIEEFHM